MPPRKRKTKGGGSKAKKTKPKAGRPKKQQRGRGVLSFAVNNPAIAAGGLAVGAAMAPQLALGLADRAGSLAMKHPRKTAALAAVAGTAYAVHRHFESRAEHDRLVDRQHEERTRRRRVDAVFDRQRLADDMYRSHYVGNPLEDDDGDVFYDAVDQDRPRWMEEIDTLD
jgi:hypothetical protein